MENTHGPGAGPCFSVPADGLPCQRLGALRPRNRGRRIRRGVMTVSDTVTWLTQEAHDRLKQEL
ncbi:MAG: hypothetical protein ACRDUV_13240, partial [Pseudonocardiaceae bacterium]